MRVTNKMVAAVLGWYYRNADKGGDITNISDEDLSSLMKQGQDICDCLIEYRPAFTFDMKYYDNPIEVVDVLHLIQTIEGWFVENRDGEVRYQLDDIKDDAIRALPGYSKLGS